MNETMKQAARRSLAPDQVSPVLLKPEARVAFGALPEHA